MLTLPIQVIVNIIQNIVQGILGAKSKPDSSKHHSNVLDRLFKSVFDAVGNLGNANASVSDSSSGNTLDEMFSLAALNAVDSIRQKMRKVEKDMRLPLRLLQEALGKMWF